MSESTTRAPRHGPPSRGISAGDVELAADALLREGDRPTIEKIRAKIGRGSPNTINPLLDAWWKRLASRLDAGPAAFHRLPESVAHVAEALWMQALDEGRRRAALEQRLAERAASADKQALEVRSHVLSLREGELDSRLKDRERTQAALESQLRELTLLLRKAEASRDAQVRRISDLEDQLLASAKRVPTTLARHRTRPKKRTRKPPARAAKPSKASSSKPRRRQRPTTRKRRR